MRALILILLVAIASPAGAADFGRWWRTRSPCPAGTSLKGAPPPKGAEVGCVKRSGVWHGRRTVWFDKCTRAAPCDARRAVRRYEGEYNRGIEHGHWVFWRKDGTRALEGEYYAGKKSGAWSTWDKAGERGVIQNQVYAAKDTPVETAILEALRTAAATGGGDLAAELEEASRDLKRSGTRGAAVDNRSRGAKSGETIAPVVSISPGNIDIPDLQMGTTSFEEGDETASPYVQKAVRQATRGVVRCYKKARAKQPKLVGEITARYEIDKSGRVGSVRIVQSTVTETMNQCVKRAILDGVKLSTHESPSPIEVISPWRFEAPGKKSSKGGQR